MSQLRNIQSNKADFSAFSFALKKLVEANPNFSLTQFNNMIAQSLGARSYEAIPFSNVSNQQAIKEPKSTTKQNVFEHRDCWRCVDCKAQWSFVISEDEVPEICPHCISKTPKEPIANTLFLVASSSGLTFDLNQTTRSVFDGITTDSVALYSNRNNPKLQSQLASTEAAIDNQSRLSFSIRRLSETNNLDLSDFCEDLDLNAKSLEAKYEHRCINDFSWAEYPYIGLGRESYQHEAGQGNTQVGYWEWVASQLEQMLDDCIVN